MCMRIFARIWAFLHAVNQTSPGEADSSLHEVFVNLTLCCQEHVEFAYYCMLVWGRWLKFAAFVLVQKQCMIWSFCRNGRWSCLCAICAALCKSAYASAKEEMTASSIVQFECVSLLVRLTCHRSYPTSHSFTLKNSSDPGKTFRWLTVVRNISFFCVKLGPHAACYIAVSSLWFCYVLHAMMFRSMHILCIHLYQWTAKKKNIIQNKKIIRPTESSFQGLRDRKQGVFLYRPNQAGIFEAEGNKSFIPGRWAR